MMAEKEGGRANGEPTTATFKEITQLTHEDAREYFLKSTSYCTLNLPPYITFDRLLIDISRLIGSRRLSDFGSGARDHTTSHTIYVGRDGRYTWRPLELVHPALYVDLVHLVTSKDNWKMLCNYLSTTLECGLTSLGLPVVSLSEQKDQAEMVGRWLTGVEKQSLELSLDYRHIVNVDISDCYGSIYTHSIPWALHGYDTAKRRKRDLKLLGNDIDRIIQWMREGQTNGIPQGPVLMDFIAEIVLTYADVKLCERISGMALDCYTILRYRDDYRIFVNNASEGSQIVKCLTEVLRDLGMKLNPSKTVSSDEVVRKSIKEDKLAWITRSKRAKTFQQQLLIIHDHAREYPHSGSLNKALMEYFKRLKKASPRSLRQLGDEPMPLISIAVDIAYHNPRTYPVCAAIIKELLSVIEEQDMVQRVVERILKKFNQIPNTGHMEMWLQRIALRSAPDIKYLEEICRVVAGDTDVEMWNSEWINSRKLKNLLHPATIVDQEKLSALPGVVSPNEVSLFWVYDGG